MIPVPSSSQRNSPVRLSHLIFKIRPYPDLVQEVWARMPDTSSASGDSDVELMAIILGAQNYPNGVGFNPNIIWHVVVDKYGVDQNLQLHGSRVARCMVNLRGRNCSWHPLSTTGLKRGCCV